MYYKGWKWKFCLYSLSLDSNNFALTKYVTSVNRICEQNLTIGK
jgi:hypothetical protein